MMRFVGAATSSQCGINKFIAVMPQSCIVGTSLVYWAAYAPFMNLQCSSVTFVGGKSIFSLIDVIVWVKFYVLSAHLAVPAI